LRFDFFAIRHLELLQLALHADLDGGIHTSGTNMGLHADLLVYKQIDHDPSEFIISLDGFEMALLMNYGAKEVDGVE